MANFKQTSRYKKAIITSNRKGKNFIISRKQLELESGNDDTFFEVTQDILKRPDLVSQLFYGSPDYWWAIYEFNGIKDPLFELKLGQILRIPAFERVLTAIEQLEE